MLHTWGQTLGHHPHVHCVVPGGGLSLDGTRWVACRPGFFLPVRVLSRLFRRLFLDALLEAFTTGQLCFFGVLEPLSHPQAFVDHLQPAREHDWVVYAKPPFGGLTQVVDYVGRYTHRVAIANHRLLETDAGQVRFRYTDYRHRQRQTTMTLAAPEFIRRLLLSGPSMPRRSFFQSRVPRPACLTTAHSPSSTTESPARSTMRRTASFGGTRCNPSSRC